MKKIIGLFLAVLMICTAFSVTTFAAESEVYHVTLVFNCDKSEVSCKPFSEYSYNPVIVTELPTPYRKDYTFCGWYENESLSGSPVKGIPAGSRGDKTYYAKWEKCYKITWHKNGGTLIHNENTPIYSREDDYMTEYTHGTVTKMYQIEKAGCVFVGWYDNAEFNGNPVTEIGATETGDKEFWAKFCNHSDMAKIKIEFNDRDKFQDKYYYCCENCGNCFSDAKGEYLICRKSQIDEYIQNQRNSLFISYYYIEASLDQSENVKLNEKYIDAKNIKILNANDTSWGTKNTDTWYVCLDDVTINGRINIAGRVHLILHDGCTLTAKNGIHLTEGNTLSVYAQSNSEAQGKLIANGSKGNAAIGGNAGWVYEEMPGPGIKRFADGDNAGTLNIFGGDVTATGNGAGGIGGGGGGNGVDLEGHEFQAGDASAGGNGGNVNIYSGIVTVSGSVGIGGGNGGNGGNGHAISIGGYIEYSVYIYGGGDGGNGGNGSNLCIYGGVLNVSGNSVAVGGGNGGNGGDSGSYNGDGVITYGEGPGSGGDGGNGGAFTVKGGTVILNGGMKAAGGGNGGFGGGESNTSQAGQNGDGISFTFAQGCKLITGDSEKNAKEETEYSGKKYLSVVGKQPSPVGFTLSEGSLVVICSVACLAVSFFVAMFIFKKKKPAVADGVENEDEK